MTFRILVPLVVLGAVIFVFRAQAYTFAFQAYQNIAPCATPIRYRIGSIDPRFDLSTSSALAALARAESVWEGPAGKQLFSFSTTSPAIVTVHFVYDERQDTTERLRSLGLTVSTNEASYDAVHEKYVAYLASYERDKASFESQQAAFEQRASLYEARVKAANARGGATPSEFAALQKQKAELETEQMRLQKLQDQVNAEADNVNALVSTLNRLANALNNAAAEYNATGASVGEEFEEAVFVSTPGREEVNVYEFDSAARLTRVLAHELGHALGLEHVDDANAIMYRLNQGESLVPTTADISEMKRACRILQ